MTDILGREKIFNYLQRHKIQQPFLNTAMGCIDVNTYKNGD